MQASTCISYVFHVSMHKNDITPSKGKETRTMGRMTSQNGGNEHRTIPPSELLPNRTRFFTIGCIGEVC